MSFVSRISHGIRPRKSHNSILLVLLSIVLLHATLFTQTVSAINFAQHAFPRTANYYLEWRITPTIADELARWDVVILDMENQISNPDLVRRLRIRNPNIVILAYITPQEIMVNAASSASQLRQRLASLMSPEWYLYDSQGRKLGLWHGTNLINVTRLAPSVDGLRWEDKFARFIKETILGSGLWDGVFLDNSWSGIRFALPGGDVDFDRDGINDYSLSSDGLWQAGMRALYDKIRTEIGQQDYIIIGNGATDVYNKQLNGEMIESFSENGWSHNMNLYRNNERGAVVPRLNIINTNTNNAGTQSNYKKMRFGLNSALLENGYYSFDSGNAKHGQIWWYDEYDVTLGQPLSVAQSVAGFSVYKPDLWRRDFEHGIAVVNSTPETVEVALGGEYEKLRSTQDSEVNDGSIVSEVLIDGYDGLILRKTFASIDDVLFPNGAFARFFRPGGEKVRNGFFVFEDKYKGGDRVSHVNLDGNSERDLLVVSGNKITAWRNDGQPFFKLFPYTRAYKGSLNVAIGDFLPDGSSSEFSEDNFSANSSSILKNNGLPELLVAPNAEFTGPIKIYSMSGEQLRDDWYPFGAAYTGGYTLAVGHTGPNAEPRLIVGATGTRKKTGTVVTIFDNNFKQVAQWPAFEKSFFGGVFVASGDLNGDGHDEIVLGSGVGKSPLIKITNELGKEIMPVFNAYSTVTKFGVTVQVADVDFDGQEDIVAFSADVGL